MRTDRELYQSAALCAARVGQSPGPYLDALMLCEVGALIASVPPVPFPARFLADCEAFERSHRC